MLGGQDMLANNRTFLANQNSVHADIGHDDVHRQSQYYTNNALYYVGIDGRNGFDHSLLNAWSPSVYSANHIAPYTPIAPRSYGHEAHSNSVHYNDPMSVMWPDYSRVIRSFAMVAQSSAGQSSAGQSSAGQSSAGPNPKPTEQNSQEQAEPARPKIFGNLGFKIGPFNFKINSAGSLKTTSATIGFKLGPFQTTMKVDNTPAMPKPDATYDFGNDDVKGQINVAFPKPPAPTPPTTSVPGATPGINPYPNIVFVPVPVPYGRLPCQAPNMCCHYRHHMPPMRGFEPLPMPRSNFITISQAARSLSQDIPIVERNLMHKLHTTALTEREIALLRVIQSPMPAALLKALRAGGVNELDLTNRNLSTAEARVENILSVGKASYLRHGLSAPNMEAYSSNEQMRNLQAEQNNEAELSF